MKYRIRHEIRGRIRLHMEQRRMTCKEADTLLYFLETLPGVTSARVYEQTGDAVVCYSGEREDILRALRSFQYRNVHVPDNVLENSGRELNRIYREKLIGRTLFHFGKKFLPFPVRAAYTGCRSVRYLAKGLKSLSRGKLEVEVLDAAAIAVSVLRADFDTAGSVMYLLGVGEILEEWTHKKSVGDLARSMSLQVKKVWLKTKEQEVLVPASVVRTGDEVVVHMGNVIPFDGIVTSGEAMVNQASMTGESMPVKKEKDSYVYAGTVLEEGEITVQVKQTSGTTRFEKIVTMIEESEKMKSGLESKAESLADRLVPYTLAGTILRP